jgi:F0F1-type ATP synthase alpha subunit
MTAQPQFDFTPPEDNVSLEGLEDFLEPSEKQQSGQSEHSETGYILHLLDRIVEVYNLMQVTSDRLVYAQERLKSLELVMRMQAEQIAVLPYYQKRVLDLEKTSKNQEITLQKQTDQLSVIPYYQGKIIELEQENAKIKAENDYLNKHWLKKLFSWFYKN